MSIFEVVKLAVAAVFIAVYFHGRRWQPYDPSWLLDLAHSQRPNDEELIEGLRECTRIRNGYFVDPRRPNRPGSPWQFARSVTLEHDELGDVVVDILKDGKIGAIEYVGFYTAGKPNKANQAGTR